MKSRPDHIVDITIGETYPPRIVQLQEVVNDLHTRDTWTRNIFSQTQKPNVYGPQF